MINKILLPLAFFLALGSGQKAVADSSDAYLTGAEAGFLGRVLQHDTVSAMESSINSDGYNSLIKVEKKQVYRCPG